jgi:hypothetical protein
MMVYDVEMATKRWELDTVGDRLEWLLRTRKRRQADLCRHLGRSSGFVSEVVSGKKEFTWDDTAKTVSFLETSADFVLGLTDDDAPPREREREQEPFYQYPESDLLAKLSDTAPEWLRQQMLAIAKAQVDSARSQVSPELAGRLRSAAQTADLILGREETSRLMATVQDSLWRGGPAQT